MVMSEAANVDTKTENPDAAKVLQDALDTARKELDAAKADKATLEKNYKAAQRNLEQTRKKVADGDKLTQAAAQLRDEYARRHAALKDDPDAQAQVAREYDARQRQMADQTRVAQLSDSINDALSGIGISDWESDPDAEYVKELWTFGRYDEAFVEAKRVVRDAKKEAKKAKANMSEPTKTSDEAKKDEKKTYSSDEVAALVKAEVERALKGTRTVDTAKGNPPPTELKPGQPGYRESLRGKPVSDIIAHINQVTKH